MIAKITRISAALILPILFSTVGCTASKPIEELPTPTPAVPQDTPEIAEKESDAAAKSGDVDGAMSRILFDTSDKQDHHEEIKKALAKAAEHNTTRTVIWVHVDGDCAAVLTRLDPPVDDRSIDWNLWVKIDGKWLSPWEKPDDEQLTKEQWESMGNVTSWADKKCRELDPQGHPAVSQ